MASAVPQVVRFRLGHLPDVGWLAGIPGVTPLELRGDLFTARVEDAERALAALRAARFPNAMLA